MKWWINSSRKLMRKNPLQVITSANGIFDDSFFASIAVYIEIEKKMISSLFQWPQVTKWCGGTHLIGTLVFNSIELLITWFYEFSIPKNEFLLSFHQTERVLLEDDYRLFTGSGNKFWISYFKIFQTNLIVLMKTSPASKYSTISTLTSLINEQSAY